MCIVRERQLSPSDLAFLSGRRFPNCEPADEEEAIQRSLAIHEEQPGDSFGFGPICLSQIIVPVEPLRAA